MTTQVFQILLCLKDGPMTASDVIDRIREGDDIGRVPSLASFYRNLKKAIDAGWLAEGDVQPTAGRPGQVYKLTRRGRTAMMEEATQLRALAERALAPDVSGTGQADV